MKTQCPSCGYEGEIKDDLIPEGGRTVGCPQCKATFTVRRNDTAKKNEPVARATDDVEVDARAFIPVRRRQNTADRTRADRLVGRIIVFVLLFVLVFILGFFAGRYTHSYTFTNPLKEAKIASGVETPRSVFGENPETTWGGAPSSSPVENTDEEDSQPSEPLILEESFTSDVFLDITEIDGKLNEVTEVTGLQRELELKEYAQDLVGKMLVGYFSVRDVGSLGSMYAKTLPLSLYSYFLEAEAESGDSKKSLIYVGLKEADELSSSLDRGSRVFIEGFIYSCVLASDHFEMGIANPKVESSR